MHANNFEHLDNKSVFSTVNVINVYLLVTITKAIYRTHLQYKS